MEAVKLSIVNKAKCPTCSRNDQVGRVRTIKGERGNNVVIVNYCRRCFIEFDNNGNIHPSLYE